ncbi:MAG: DNA mismatch repair protein MutS [Sphingobium sp.]|nr:DNA mismatch repair protein MutS [Sphingobium sp.]
MWDRLSQTVRPIPGRRSASVKKAVPVPQVLMLPDEPSEAVSKALRASASLRKVETPLSSPRSRPVAKLDDGWEKRITSGNIAPEMSIDLHGYTLSAAHQRLDQMLGSAVMRGVRVLLVVTGNPRPAPTALHEERTRGAIRAEIGHWLALSPHADAIASVRTAHPRHGGRGALYIILRRNR